METSDEGHAIPTKKGVNLTPEDAASVAEAIKMVTKFHEEEWNEESGGSSESYTKKGKFRGKESDDEEERPDRKRKWVDRSNKFKRNH